MAKRWCNTTDLPNDELKALYWAVCPPGLPAHDVAIRNTKHRGGAGTAYTRGSRLHATRRPHIVVRVPKTEERARRIWLGGDGYLPHTTGSRRESYLYIMAHELRHLWQGKAKGRPRGMVYGAKGRYSERDADAYAIQMLRRYRRGELLTPAVQEVAA